MSRAKFSEWSTETLRGEEWMYWVGLGLGLGLGLWLGSVFFLQMMMIIIPKWEDNLLKSTLGPISFPVVFPLGCGAARKTLGNQLYWFPKNNDTTIPDVIFQRAMGNPCEGKPFANQYALSMFFKQHYYYYTAIPVECIWQKLKNERFTIPSW